MKDWYGKSAGIRDESCASRYTTSARQAKLNEAKERIVLRTPLCFGTLKG